MTNARGSLLFGYGVDLFLYGVLTVQIYLYYLAFPNDRKVTQATAYFVYIVGTLQLALALHDFYMLFRIPNDPRFQGQDFDFQTFGFMWFTVPVSGVLVASVVQLFYARHIYEVWKAKVVTGIVCLLSVIQLVFGIIGGVSSFTTSAQFRVGRVGFPSLVTGCVAGVISDLLIATYMLRDLSRQMKGGSRTTQVLLTKILRLLLETGILTAGMAITYMILLCFAGPKYAYMVPGLSLGKFYSNSILSLLNNRFTIIGGRNTKHPDFDIASRGHSELSGTNVGPVVSRSMTFALGHRAEALASNTIHTIEFKPQLGPIFEKPVEAGEKKVEIERD